jgi:TonB-dependent receptor
MNRKNPIALLFGWIALGLVPSQSAAAEASPAGVIQPKGSVTGRVKNRVTELYLNNARVSVKGTDIVVFTDSFGVYRIVNLPAGPVTLEVYYTDLDAQEVSLNVPADGSLQQDFELTSKARYGDNVAVKLDPFIIAADKETDAEAIAINEQRFAPNIKNVMATDSLGNVVGNAVGEFLKFMPGLTAEYGQETIFEISVRGIGGGLTSFTADGAPMVSVNMFFGGGRTFNVDSLSLNDLSRIEVTKVPTPASAADSLAGSINMVSKSAFERSRAQLRYGISLVGNSENLSLKKTPFSNTDAKTWAIWPNYDFDYTLPIGRNFGIVITGMWSDRFHEQHLSTMTHNTAGTATGASVSRPYLNQYRLQDGPARKTRSTLSLKADWRISKNAVLSFNGQLNQFKNIIGTFNWDMIAGTNGNPTVAGGTPMSFGEDYTTGATGRGAVNMSTIFQTIKGGAEVVGLKYRHDDGQWRVESGVSYSSSYWDRDNFKGGHFQNLAATLLVPVRVAFSGISPDRPGTIQAFDNANREVDIYDIDNYRITSGANTPYNNESSVRSANASLRRSINKFSFPASIQAGAFYRLQTMDVRTQTESYTYGGPDGNPLTFDPARPYAMAVYRNQDSHYGFKNVPWVSPRGALTAWRDNPILFSQTPAQVVAEEATRMTNSEFIQEAVSAYYLQLEASLLRNRLKVLTGVRFEKTDGSGEGSRSDPNAVYVRNPDGTFARNAQGIRLRRLEAGAVGSMEELRLVQQERAAKSERSYDGYYPSLHLNYSVTENLLLRTAYARTYGRPAFADIIPRTVINQGNLTEEEMENPDIVQGTLTVRNAALRPWTADNYDLSAEYYTAQGGMFSAGVFLKEIRNFFGSSVRLATIGDLEALGLDPMYVGWNLATKFNAGDARVSGAEFNLRHSLRFLGAWGNHFTVFANATKLKLEGNPYASFTSFIPESGNWGASFSRKRLTILARWNYRGLDQRTAVPAYGTGAFTYIKARVTMDLSVGYQLTPRLSFAASVNNVFNEPQITQRYGASTPAYAKQFRTEEFGIPITVGIRGTF